nr:zinc finger, CCHC-type, retrotransposon Gag domain protein [Tanacetum cinerariifolium]
ERLKREYHSIRQTDTETSTDFMQRVLRLAGFLRAAAGTAEEQAKNFQWGLRKSTLNHLMCIPFTDLAQVANAAHNYEILHERDDDDAERPDKRQKSGEAVVTTTAATTTTLATTTGVPNCVSISTAEYDYVTVSGCRAQVLWMRTQLTDYGFFYDKIPIYCDLKSAIAISCNPVQHTRTKHIDVRSSSKLARDQTSNPTSSTNPTPKGRIHRSSKQKVENSHFEENLTPVDTMTDNRTMAKMLRAPTEGCAEAIKFDESFHEAWERYKDILRASPHHGFTELHQLDTFYNALNPADQDSLNAAAGGNLLEKSPQDALTIIENKSKVRNSRSKPIASQVNAYDNHSSSELAKLTHTVNQQTSAVTTAMTAMLKQL